MLFKLFVIMKLSMLFILLGILQARADVHGQGAITLNVQQTEIARVLTKIEKKGEARTLSPARKNLAVGLFRFGTAAQVSPDQKCNGQASP